MAHARRRLGPAVAPREIAFRDNLPKTRSGKIMRRLLRARELGLPEGDLSTLESDERTMTGKPHLDRAHARHLLAPDAAHPPVRGEVRRALHPAEDPRLPASLYRRGSERRRHHGGAGPQDSVVATYREHGHAMARGIAMGPLMAEMYGKMNGTSRGRGGSMHIFDRRTRFYGGNAIVGGGLPLAVGLALAEKMRKGPGVAVCLFGEGAVAEGEFHESLNLAALWKLPVLFVCENNLYAMGSALERTESETDIHAKAQSYRVEAHRVDGMDVVAVEAATRAAVGAPARGRRPAIPRMHDLPLPRPFDVRCPALSRQGGSGTLEGARSDQALRRMGCGERACCTKPTSRRWRRRRRTRSMQAVAFAEAGAWEPVADLCRFTLMDEVPS